MKMAYKLTNIKMFYVFLQALIFNFKEVRQTRPLISKAFQEKIILAVTQVNGCRMCNYVHSKAALESGVGEDEIKMLLTGDFEKLTQEEAEGILFAQHYAEARGDYDKSLYKKLEEDLGVDRAKAVLSTIRIIMVANTHGIALDLLKMRITGKADKSSTLKDELGIAFGMFFMVPVVFIQKFL